MGHSMPIRKAGAGELLFVIVAAILALALAATNAFGAKPKLISHAIKVQPR